MAKLEALKPKFTAFIRMLEEAEQDEQITTRIQWLKECRLRASIFNLVAQGASIAVAARTLGLPLGQTASQWNKFRKMAGLYKSQQVKKVERDTINLLFDFGWDTQKIAKKLGISVVTVESYGRRRPHKTDHGTEGGA